MRLRYSIELGTNLLKGVLTSSDEGLRVEWRRYDLMETPREPLKSLTVGWSDLLSVSIRKRPWRPRIDITAKEASAFGDMPLPAGDLSTLSAKVERIDRNRAAAWAADATLRIAEAMTGDTLLE